MRPRLIILLMLLFVKPLYVSMTLLLCSDVRKFDADSILFGEIQCKTIDIFMFQRRFQCGFGWTQVKYARITITHVCFIALTLAGSLGQCLNSFLGIWQMLMHEKTCVIPIFGYNKPKYFCHGIVQRNYKNYRKMTILRSFSYNSCD